MVIDQQQQRRSPTTPSTYSRQTSVSRMDSQYQEISPRPNSATGTPRFSTRHHQYDSSITSTKNARHPEIDSTNPATSTTNSTGHLFYIHASSSSHICDSSCTYIYPASVMVQEPVCAQNTRLGHSSPSSSRMQERTELVATESPQMERQVISSINTLGYSSGRREQPRLGLSVSRPTSPRLLEPSRATEFNQLERVESSIPGTQVFSATTEYNSPSSDRQHDIIVSHKQTRRHQILSIDDTGHVYLEMVPQTQPQPLGGSHTRRRQSSSGSGVSPYFYQEPLANLPQSLSAAARCGSLRRPAHPPPTKICLLDTGSGINISGCFQYTVVPLYPSLAQPSLEPHQPVSPEDSAGSPTSGNSRHSVLAQRDMDPSGATPRQIGTVEFEPRMNFNWTVRFPVELERISEIGT